MTPVNPSIALSPPSPAAPSPTSATPSNPVARPTVHDSLSADGIHLQRNGYLVVSSGNIMEILTYDGAVHYRFRYFRHDFLSPSAKDLLVMKFRVLQDDAVAQFIGLTDEQRQKLMAISSARTLEAVFQPLDKDRDAVIAQWHQYLTAPDWSTKSQVEQNLLATLKRVGDENLAATRHIAEERVNQINSILTLEQITKFQNMNGSH